ncbi:MAG: hypothetical protein P1U58_16615 [Verrucomicrobiales bacterium]|nr:hypothetical protein [Verrucomicrobiales bacterium]
MGYTVQEVTGDASANTALALFIASFVKDGGLRRPMDGDDCAEVWRKRFTWWWDENPSCRDDSPRGFILITSEGEIVGFSGFIPLDYEMDGEIIPALIATTFFVREAHRSAVMGLLSRQRSLGRSYHIIDGSPSPEMRTLLNKLGYEHAGERFQYYFPLTGFGGAATQLLLEQAGLSLSLPKRKELLSSFYLATSPEEIETIPTNHDSKLRRRITPEYLDWLCRVGSGERSFFGLCDAKGELMAYAVGIYKRKLGFCLCLLEDYMDFRPQEGALGQLIRMIMEDPIGSGVARDTDALALSVLGDSEEYQQKGIRRNSNLYFHLPEGIDPSSKRCLPIEGDLALI